jgi:hypothetical protein
MFIVEEDILIPALRRRKQSFPLSMVTWVNRIQRMGFGKPAREQD